MSLPYKYIPIWENKCRQKMLLHFKEQVRIYFDGSHPDEVTGQHMIEDGKATQARSQINNDLVAVSKAIRESGINTIFRWRASQAMGGFERSVNVVTDIFSLYQMEMFGDQTVDPPPPPPPVYKHDQTSAWIRTFNPFFWLSKLARFISNVPSIVIKEFGKDPKSYEKSIFGKVVRIIIEATVWLAALLTIVDLVGLLDSLLSIIK